MRILIGLWLGLFIITPAWAAGTATTASRVFAADSPSIVVVKAFNSSGHAIEQGSGVVIAKGVVVSNCHVFEQASTVTASVFYHHKRLPATLRYGDPEHDLCSFTVKGLTAPPIRMGATAELKVGENAYAIGAPEGFDLTLSGGLISGLRHIPGGVVIQMTTPISPGSSGGGLFDSRGRLIGITSYYAKKGQQLNFALPVEWIKALPRRGKTFKELAGQSSKIHAGFQKGIQAESSGDYAEALSIFKPLAEKGNSGAQLQLGWMYDTGDGVLQDYTKALYWYRKSATQGYADAQYNLGLIYVNGQGVPQDHAKAVYWFRKAAVQGLANAQYNLGQMYREGQGVAQDYTKAVYWYRKAAVQGYADAQNNLGWMYDTGHGVTQDDAKALYWYRKAAVQGLANAQYNLGQMYREGQGVAQDHAKAAYWFRKAAAQGLADAQTSLGWMYDTGDGVLQDYTKALYWYRKSAAQGNVNAQTNLGRMYATGHGVPRDYTKSAYWRRKAAEQGSAISQDALGALYYTGQGVPQDYVLGAKWAILAKAGGDKDVSKLLTLLEQEMTPSQIAEAQRLANQWWEAHHKQ